VTQAVESPASSREHSVRHNRDAEFRLANLGTMLEAMAGLFALTVKASNHDWEPSHSIFSSAGGSFRRAILSHRDKLECSGRALTSAFVLDLSCRMRS